MSVVSPPVDSYYATSSDVTMGAGAPRSPRHYNKYTYAAKRRPENEAGEYRPLSPRSQRRQRGDMTEYEALVAGLAPLRPSADGFCVAEDGSVSSRFVSPARISAPAIAMVGVPVAVYPTLRGGGNGGVSAALTYVPHGSGAGITAGRLLANSDVDPVPPAEVEAWNKFLSLAENDFTEREIADMSWEVLERLLGHYRMTNPVEIARVQLMWRRKHAVLPSDTMAPQLGAGVTPKREGSQHSTGSEYYIPAALARTQHAVPANISFQTGPTTSPRRSPGVRYVPPHRQKLDYSHVSPKVDTGRRPGSATPGRPSSRANTPTRASMQSSGISPISK